MSGRGRGHWATRRIKHKCSPEDRPPRPAEESEPDEGEPADVTVDEDAEPEMIRIREPEPRL